MGNCFNSIVVNAPVEKVWEKVRNFHDMSWAKGVVEKTVVVGDKKATEVGAKRVLNDAFHETLTKLCDDTRRLDYTIDDGPPPINKDAVTSYVGSISVRPITADGTTFVQWTSKYETADDAKVGEFCNPIYVALLDALKKAFA